MNLAVALSLTGKYRDAKLLLLQIDRSNLWLSRQFGEEWLLKKSIIEALIIYGSPYVLDWFQREMSLDIPWVFSYGQTRESQAIACQKLFNLSASKLTEMSQNLGDVFI